MQDAIVIREVDSGNGSKSYELYDSDTGSSLGNYDSLERAKEEQRHMNSSDLAAQKGGADADPSVE